MDRILDLGTVRRVALIELRSVTKAYDDHLALDHVSTEIERGEFVYLVGHSGSGKSSLLRLLTRELVADTGEVLVDGVDVGWLPGRKLPQLRQHVAVVPQEHQLLQNRSVLENVLFALNVLGWRRASAKRRAWEMLELVGLDRLAQRKPGELSGGERQRVAIARAVAPGPGILLADEPTGNLDPTTTAAIAVLLDDVSQSGCTVLMATHDARVVDAMQRRVLALRNGQVVGDGDGRYSEVLS